MKSKRGSHVGIVLSFVVFVTFLIFIYSTLEPIIKQDEGKKALLQEVKGKLVAEFTANLTKVTLKTVEEDEDGCEEITLQNLELEGSGTYYYFYRERELFVSEESFVEGDVLPYECTPEDGDIGRVDTKEYIFLSKVDSVSGQVYNDLKERFEITEGNFYFGFGEIGDGYVNQGGFEEMIPDDVSVYADEELVQYVDKEAIINTDKLKVMVW
jgi:hypothetical protein